MKQTWKVGTIVLTCLMMVGCHRGESERLADMADRTIQMQSEQNLASANAHQEFVTLNSNLQTERSNLNQQFEELEQGRRDLHRLRRSELAWSESFRFLAIVIAAVMPLFLCAYLVWAACRRSGCHEAVNELLIHELVSPKPRLIAAPNLRGIEHQPDERDSNSTKDGDNS
jgi:hypothetical protein